MAAGLKEGDWVFVTDDQYKYQIGRVKATRLGHNRQEARVDILVRRNQALSWIKHNFLVNVQKLRQCAPGEELLAEWMLLELGR
jgi:hypothetical protein